MTTGGRAPGAERRRLADGVVAVTLDGETVAWDELSGALHHLDPVGSAVLAACDGARDDEAVVRETAARFSAPVEVARPDVLAFLDHLQGLGLLVRAEG